MDKRFFLALFLSLIAIAVSQLLFPPPKAVPSSQRNGVNDSAAKKMAASSTNEVVAPESSGAPAGVSPTKSPSEKTSVTTRAVAETTVVSTQKEIGRATSSEGGYKCRLNQ